MRRPDAPGAEPWCAVLDCDGVGPYAVEVKGLTFLVCADHAQKLNPNIFKDSET